LITRLHRALALVLFALLAGCTTAADVGEACVDSGDCLADLACAERTGPGEPQVCMERCDPAMTWLCEGGLYCQPLAGASDRGVCYLGGTLTAGSSCLDRGLDCTSGTVCVVFEDGVRHECMEACRIGGTDCADGETCRPLDTTRNGGFCEPAS